MQVPARLVDALDVPHFVDVAVAVQTPCLNQINNAFNCRSWLLITNTNINLPFPARPAPQSFVLVPKGANECAYAVSPSLLPVCEPAFEGLMGQGYETREPRRMILTVAPMASHCEHHTVLCPQDYANHVANTSLALFNLPHSHLYHPHFKFSTYPYPAWTALGRATKRRASTTITICSASAATNATPRRLLCPHTHTATGRRCRNMTMLQLLQYVVRRPAAAATTSLSVRQQE
ncbi:hypothetical protein GALMADRAFT_1303975 [Galerina marginata CBS 339.88]|uniref:Uncharacterized protein n=1 Tax=Galerina marginata (strain CBS 339.88) TaxID=685588 RepID=A0A067TE23_GALM3|nr:hypothetical protein GALMADRAFT_1303975 [Galerina marginata CBS 339.88]